MMDVQRCELHDHSMYSNLRLLDCIIRPQDLVNRAIELGLKGIAITDHEALCCHIELNQLQQELYTTNPDFKIILGNEIYLVDECPTDNHWHFILLAKDAIGHEQLRYLSSIAWMNSYTAKGLERVDTLKSDLEKVVLANPGHLIASTACLGGELDKLTMALIKAELQEDGVGAQIAHGKIIQFMLWCQKLFGKDFYIECQPGVSKDQIIVNKRLVNIAKAFKVKMIVTCDAHYLKPEDRLIHKAYLNSKDGDRETDEFYRDAYLKTNDEIIRDLKLSGFSESFVMEMFNNSMEIYNKIERYSLLHSQQIPKVSVDYYAPIQKDTYFAKKFPVLTSLYNSDNDVERYWINECEQALRKENRETDYVYIARLEEEARVKRVIGEKLGTNMFQYPVTLKHYVDLFWECGSLVGAGRGSSCSGLNHYLLGITQLDPIKWRLPWWRYLNDERVELGDIDIDLAPSKVGRILRRIKAERGANFYEGIDELSRKNLGCTRIATFGTEGSKSAILTACRGYRSEDFPEGIDVDTAQYLASLIPSERGFVWPIKDVVYGNPGKDRKPIAAFVQELNQFTGLLDIAVGIEGLVNKRSSHASGIIFFDENPYEHCAFMRTPSGEVITQFDLHKAEAAGLTKYDFLVTSIQDKLGKCIEFMQEDHVIEDNLSLKEIYNKYFHPRILPIENKKTWEAIQDVRVLNLFQFDSDVGSQAAKKIRPSTITELSDSNGLMRLMTSEKGAETPMEKYIRFKNNIKLWYQEMDSYGLTKAEQKTFEPYFLSSYGVPPSQEQMMQMLMDKNLCNFTLAEANAARKIVGKKQMNKIPELREKVEKQAASPAIGKYLWDCGIGPQMGYSFSMIHALAYSFIGYQCAYIATNWNPIYWNAACLVVNSETIEEAEDDEIENNGTTDYAKIAEAIGAIRANDIHVSLVNINDSAYSFKPDVKNNRILFGMGALSGINSEIITQIINGRPYTGIKDFMLRCQLKKPAMISLIKAGAFDDLDAEWAQKISTEPRIAIMAYYIMSISEPKKRLTLQNFSSLIQKGMIPDTLEFQKRVFAFNNYLKNFKKGTHYLLDDIALSFYQTFFDTDKLTVMGPFTYISQKEWDKMYKAEIETAKEWLKENQEEMLKLVNAQLFKEMWDKYATGTLSSWEMDSVCFYYHDHELAKVDKNKYGIVNFFDKPRTPEVEYYFKRNGKEIPIFKLDRIAGTVIAKNDTRSSISLLTTDGVVSVKFTKEYYAMANRQISEVQADGTKKIQEQGWFKRGTKLLITGFRREDTFVAKRYAKTSGHQLYKITAINGNEIALEHERYGVKND